MNDLVVFNWLLRIITYMLQMATCVYKITNYINKKSDEQFNKIFFLMVVHLLLPAIHPFMYVYTESHICGIQLFTYLHKATKGPSSK